MFEQVSHVNRRTALAVISGCLTAHAPTSYGASKARLYRIGSLCAGEVIPYFWNQLRGLGYEEHRNVEYILKDVDSRTDLPGFAAQLAMANVDIIVACGNDDAKAALRATSRIPIVLLYGIAPVEAGLVNRSHDRAAISPARRPFRRIWRRSPSKFSRVPCQDFGDSPSSST